MLVMPIIFVLQGRGRGNAGMGGFSMALTGAYLGLVPLLAINLLRYSQQWQASDAFRAAPVPGPAPLCHGMRRAVLSCLTLPLLVSLGVIAWLLIKKTSDLLLFLPGVIALPVYGMAACLGGKAVPFSVPTEEAKAAGRGAIFVGSMMIAFVIAGIVAWAWSNGFFWWLVLIETIAASILYVAMRRSLARVSWSSME